MNVKVIIITTIVIPAVMALFFQIFNPEVTMLADTIRNNPFETFVVIVLCAILAILYKGLYKRTSH